MKTLVLSNQHGPDAQSDPVKQPQTSTNQKRRRGKRAWWKLIDTIGECIYWVIVSLMWIMSAVMLIGFFRVWAFGQDYHYSPQWCDVPARWVLTQIMSESPTIDPDKVSIVDID